MRSPAASIAGSPARGRKVGADTVLGEADSPVHSVARGREEGSGTAHSSWRQSVVTLRLTVFPAALQGRPAVVDQSQVEQLLLEVFRGGRLERVSDFLKQQVGELLAGAVEDLADAGSG